MMISRSVESSSRLSMRLPLTATDLVAAEGFSACVPAFASLSPEVAVIVLVAPHRCCRCQLVQLGAGAIQPLQFTIDIKSGLRSLTPEESPRNQMRRCKRMACSEKWQPASRCNRRSARQPDPRKRSQVGVVMADGAGLSRAFVLGASIFSLAVLTGDPGYAQTADTGAAAPSSQQKKQAKRKPAKPQLEQQASPSVMNARAQIGGTPVQSLDTITVAASKTEERAIDALAPVSVVTLEQIQGRQASTVGDLLYNIP